MEVIAMRQVPTLLLCLLVTTVYTVTTLQEILVLSLRWMMSIENEKRDVAYRTSVRGERGHQIGLIIPKQINVD